MPDLILRPIYGDSPNLPLSLPVVLAGTDGIDGASAYQLAVADGFSGTKADWLASLVGQLSADDRTAVQQAVTVGQAVSARLDGLDQAAADITVSASQIADDRAASTAAVTATTASATIATTSAAMADQSAKDAQNAATTASATLADFRARWMGALAVPPASQVIDGALYFDTTGARLMMWRASAWQAVATGPAAADLLTLIKSVDGIGSGLDADMIRGAPGQQFARTVFLGSLKTGVTYPAGWSFAPLTPIFDPFGLYNAATATLDEAKLPARPGGVIRRYIGRIQVPTVAPLTTGIGKIATSYDASTPLTWLDLAASSPNDMISRVYDTASLSTANWYCQPQIHGLRVFNKTGADFVLAASATNDRRASAATLQLSFYDLI